MPLVAIRGAIDFLRTYRAAIADVERADVQRDALLQRQVRASAAIEAELRKGKRVVRIMNAVLRASLRNEPALLATWEQSQGRPP